LKKIREFEEASAFKDPFFINEWLQEIVPTFHPAEIKTSVTSPSPMMEKAVIVG